MVGHTLKHYTIEQKLGQGGMGVVYRARDTRLGRAVALKVLAKEVTGDSERRRRFVREAQAAAAVTHPAIAQIYDVDDADGVIFIAMELVEGRTVRQMIAAGDVDMLRAMDIAIQVGAGLAKAHEAGIVHRDVKSDNVMLTAEGHAKLLDFGLAKLVEPDGASDASDLLTRGHTSAVTQSGMVLGTIAYMSPEQARGRGVDQRSDIFSLGVMLYEMSTGEMPFAGSSPLDTMHAIAFDEARPVTQIRPGLPPDLQRVVARCLRKRPEDRYQTMREVVDDLTRLRRDTESGTVRALRLGERLQQHLAGLPALSTLNRGWVAAGLGLLTLVVVLVATQKARLGTIVFFAFVGLLVYRRVRNRRHALVRKCVARLRKTAEVKVVALDGDNLEVVVDEVQAALYARLHDMVDGINRKLYFGSPLTSSIRQEADAAELARLIQRPGILYVRPDVANAARISTATPAR